MARRAASLGAVVINDIWGLQQDPAMAGTIAETETAVVVTHNREALDDTIDIIGDIRRFFDRSLALAQRTGIPRGRIILDPGIGFAKSSRQNRTALARLAEFKDYGLPILVGASRKRFLGSLTGDGIEGTLIGTIAANLAAITAGAAIVRVHDVRRARGRAQSLSHHLQRRRLTARHLWQSVSCFSSMTKTPPSFTATLRTRQARPILSVSFTS